MPVVLGIMILGNLQQHLLTCSSRTISTPC